MAPIAAHAYEPIAPGPSAPSAGSKIQDNVLTGVEASPNAYFIEFAGASVSAGGSLNAIQAERDTFLADAEAAGVEVEVRQEFGSLWNGISVNAAEADLESLAASKVVVAIYPVGIIEAPELPEGTIDPDMFTAPGMTGADIVVSEMGITGEGIKVGIIDTGVDIDHPDLGGGGTNGGTAFPSARVTHGYDLVGDSYNADPSGPSYQPNPMPDENPDDCQGHGTHVAGIVGAKAAAEGGVNGVAPDVTFGAYRVFGCDGSTESDIMLHAMERSLNDGMDVVNLSIGSAFSSWAEYPTSQATDALAREGVVVVASIGNEGDYGLHAAGSPGVGRDTIGVGSVDNVAYMSASFEDADGNAVPYVEADAAPAPIGETVDVVAVFEPGTPEAQGCPPDAYTADQQAVIDGNWLLVQRGTCSFYEKSYAAQEAGAAGVIIYNNAPGVINPTVAGDPPVTVPVIMVSDTDGAALVADAIDAGTTITFTGETTTAPNPTGGLMSDFSSYGPTADMTFKPDVAAPGGSIYSTYPLEKSPYGSLSGTSMAAPHVAGAVALMLEAEPGQTPAEVKTRLQNSSVQLNWNLNAGLGYLDVVSKQGAGMIQVDDAILADVSLEPGLIQLGQQEAATPSTETVTLTNRTDEDLTYAISHREALVTEGTGHGFSFGAAAADVTFPESVTVPAGGTATVEVSIAQEYENLQYGGYIYFTNGDDVYSVGYGGYTGDLQAVEVLADYYNADGTVAFELPVLAQLSSCDYFVGVECTDAEGTWDVYPEGSPTYTMVEGDVPSAAVSFEHQARKVVWTAYEANEDGTKGASLGVVQEEDYVSRTAATNAIRIYTWDGRTVEDNGARVDVPNGAYILEMEVTKAKAWNDEREAETELYTSQAFMIEREGDMTDLPAISRAFGPERYGTAMELAVENFEPGVDTVYIANGLNYPDALSGGALAGEMGAPILLVKGANPDDSEAPHAVPASTRIGLEHLQPANVVVLGGPEAINEDVAAVLAEYGEVSRLAGANRYATSVAISQEFAQSGADLVFVATGEDYADALTASAVAGVEGAPVLLVKKDTLPGDVQDELARLNPGKVVVLGGTEAISTKVASQAKAYGADFERIGGVNRYSTAAKVANAFFDAPTKHTMLASGEAFPDALTAGPVAAKNQTPVLLSKLDTLPGVSSDVIVNLGIQNVTIVGGYEAISLAVQEALEAIVLP